MATGPLHITIQAQPFDDGYSESLTVKERKEIPLKYFAWPDAPGGKPKYPADTQDHLDSLAKLIGRAPEDVQAKIKARAMRIAKELGLKLPDSWKEETTESIDTFHLGVVAVSNGTQIFLESAPNQRPQKKIGTLPICWLEYNARSLNGRIYPKATCDAIFRAAQKKLADPDALPPTTFVSHEAANGNVNTELVGGPTKIWQEGNKFWANIDLADTSVARDMLGLAEGKYLRSGSMRVLGVELRHDRNYDLPLVVIQEGVEPEFLGIDLTTRPGLDKVARIPQVLYESDGREPYIESFDFAVLPVQKEVPPAMGTPIYLQAALGMLTEAKSSREAHTAIHDHLAGVMDECFGSKHGMESARYRALIEGQLDEAGRAIAMKHASRLAAAHDESAKQLGMKCEGCYNDMVGNPDNNMDGDSDGDNPAAGNDPDHDGESRQKEKPLTEQEMLEALRAKGFTVEAPKSDKEEIADLKRMLAEQSAQLKQLSESQAAPPARQTVTESQFTEQTHLQPERLYESGDYLKGDLHPRNWRALSNPQVPWPADLDPKMVLHELTPFMNYSLLNMQEAAAGRSLHEQVKLGLFDN